ncbi:hypothetical protein Cgig2_001954 [Carnegiea gigantea]|uniref:DUF4283 domain-containing protein n=1 Tax=Carnegiea gigantea TaxID=171969 RepID=A0A9Q1JVE4_9CARY|nr:hypothetical protein Cgig2_001954 [Carnegiea gigantea]
MARGRSGRPRSVTDGHRSPAPAATSSSADLALAPDHTAPESAITLKEKSPSPNSISGAAAQGYTAAATQLNSAAGSRTQETIHGSPQSQPICSYAELVYPNEGTELNLVPTKIINGVTCTKLEKSDVEAEINYWYNAVLCKVLGAKPPIEIMKGFLNRIWANHNIDKINSREMCKPVLVKESIRSLPLWIQLPALDIKYWGAESLSKISSVLGIPIKPDKFTKDKQVIRYARLLIEMPIDGPFPHRNFQ